MTSNVDGGCRNQEKARLEIVRCQASVLRNPRQHSRTEFFIVIKGEDKIRAPRFRERWWEPDWRLSVQPLRSSAARTRRAFVAGQLLTPLGK